MACDACAGKAQAAGKRCQEGSQERAGGQDKAQHSDRRGAWSGVRAAAAPPVAADAVAADWGKASVCGPVRHAHGGERELERRAAGAGPRTHRWPRLAPVRSSVCFCSRVFALQPRSICPSCWHNTLLAWANALLRRMHKGCHAGNYVACKEPFAYCVGVICMACSAFGPSPALRCHAGWTQIAMHVLAVDHRCSIHPEPDLAARTSGAGWTRARRT